MNFREYSFRGKSLLEYLGLIKKILLYKLFRKLPGYRTLLLTEFHNGIFFMDPFHTDYYLFREPQNWPNLYPAPKTDFVWGSVFWDPVFGGAAFGDPGFWTFWDPPFLNN